MIFKPKYTRCASIGSVTNLYGPEAEGTQGFAILGLQFLVPR